MAIEKPNTPMLAAAALAHAWNQPQSIDFPLEDDRGSEGAGIHQGLLA
jgi:hypothetical protein